MIHVNDANVAIMGYISHAKNIDDDDKEQLIVIQGLIRDALSLLKTVRDDVVKRDQNPFRILLV